MALKFGRRASERVHREALAGSGERKDSRWRSAVAGVAATALAAGAWLGISNSNEKSPTKEATSLSEVASSISPEQQSAITTELGNSIQNSFDNAVQNLADYPDTAVDFNLDMRMASFSFPTDPGTQSRSVSAGVEIRSDGSGRLIVTSREGGYAGDNVEAESYYAVQFYVTKKALIEAAKDGKLDSVDVTNMLGDGGTQFSGIGIGTIGISYGEMNRYDKYIHVSREGDISARGYTSKFNPDSDESRVTTESVSVLATKVDLANAVNYAKNSFDRQAAK